MKEITQILTVLALIFGTSLCAIPSMAQHVYGTLGSPSAAESIDGKQLPAPEPKFGRVIKVDRPQLSPEDIKKLQHAERNNKMTE